MKFVLHSIHTLKSNGSAQDVLVRLVFAPNQIPIRHSPQTTRFVIFNFGTKFYQNEISHQNENLIRNENRSELISERLVREQMFVSVSCEHYANKYMEME